MRISDWSSDVCSSDLRQFGTEDQGWVAHFLISALEDRPITVYGDGKQVRDILYVSDAVSAYLLAQARMGRLQGRVFNLGGGMENAVSLLDLLSLITRIHNRRLRVEFGPWRAGDQAYYVSDTAAFRAATGWRPSVDAETGVRRLFEWLRQRTSRRSMEEIPARDMPSTIRTGASRGGSISAAARHTCSWSWATPRRCWRVA